MVSILQDVVLEEVLHLLVHVEVLQVVNDANVVEVLATRAHEEMSAAHEILSDRLEQVLSELGVSAMATSNGHAALVLKHLSPLLVVDMVLLDTEKE